MISLTSFSSVLYSAFKYLSLEMSTSGGFGNLIDIPLVALLTLSASPARMLIIWKFCARYFRSAYGIVSRPSPGSTALFLKLSDARRRCLISFPFRTAAFTWPDFLDGRLEKSPFLSLLAPRFRCRFPSPLSFLSYLNHCIFMLFHCSF